MEETVTISRETYDDLNKLQGTYEAEIKELEAKNEKLMDRKVIVSMEYSVETLYRIPKNWMVLSDDELVDLTINKITEEFNKTSKDYHEKMHKIYNRNLIQRIFNIKIK